ncbi:DUF2147 domain-containing protein [Gammaproteobacteria bacterium AB-CW1]|uniref:DUF2147 domain-containing protein n=1 Tax=Natronospira elongata TaxID=3110268 RepID=A0AAP6JCG8_9GAMM|nr:DUF2147 domain-containing protein [Gammaproteobacteria bacterium AB-CW1]
MKSVMPSLLVLLLAPGLILAADSGVEGLWWTEDREAVVETRIVDEQLTGRIIWLEQPYHDDGDREGELLRDRENPESDRRDQPVLGMTILSGFEKHREGDWRRGEAYDPDNGRTYSARVRLQDDGATLRLRGYVGSPVFGRSAHWERLEGQPPRDSGMHVDELGERQ